SFIVYRRLRETNPAPYMFHISMPGTPGTVAIGASPELLVRVEDRVATMRPIAGTTAVADGNSSEKLAHFARDVKELAEHVMLVDLCRNDLSRIFSVGRSVGLYGPALVVAGQRPCGRADSVKVVRSRDTSVGGVAVDDFLRVERYRHVYHLLSNVTARMRP